MIRVSPLDLPEVLEIVSARFGDERGFFSEVYNSVALAEQGIAVDFCQDNQSVSTSRGVLRGLHYQVPPFAQTKLVRVARGSIFDVAVDIRRGSPDFGRWVGLVVSAERWNQILVPVGFAHGFVTLERYTEVHYKVSAPYSPEHERAVIFDDPDIAIEWPVEPASLTLSAKDRAAPLLEAQEDTFVFGDGR